MDRRGRRRRDGGTLDDARRRIDARAARDVAPGKPAFFEFLRIEATPKGIVYLASPRGAPATPFPLVESGGNRAVFENREHDFPTRIIYRLTPDGSLHARVEGTKKGKPVFEEWTWKKVR